jgi:hypothetical protein
MDFEGFCASIFVSNATELSPLTFVTSTKGVSKFSRQIVPWMLTRWRPELVVCRHSGAW